MKKAHSVRDHLAGFGPGPDHQTSRAHAERVDAAVVGTAEGEVIIGGRQAGMAGRGSVLDAVHEALGVFHPEADGEWFGLQGHPGSAQHPKRVPRAVADGQKEDGSRDSDLPVQDGPPDGPLVNFQPRQLGTESIFRPLFLQIFSEGQNDFSETVRAQMGFLKGKDFLRGAEAAKSFQYKGDSRVLNTGVKLAIRKGAGPPFPELHVAFRVQFSFLPKEIHVFNSLGDFLSPIDNQGRRSTFGQVQGRKKACRAGADDERTLLGFLATRRRRERGSSRGKNSDAEESRTCFSKSGSKEMVRA